MTFLESATSVAVVIVPLVGLQTFWIARALDRLEGRMAAMEATVIELARVVDRTKGRVDRLDTKS